MFLPPELPSEQMEPGTSLGALWKGERQCRNGQFDVSPVCQMINRRPLSLSQNGIFPPLQSAYECEGVIKSASVMWQHEKQGCP